MEDLLFLKKKKQKDFFYAGPWALQQPGNRRADKRLAASVASSAASVASKPVVLNRHFSLPPVPEPFYMIHENGG
jgi:hypothetical protein